MAGVTGTKGRWGGGEVGNRAENLGEEESYCVCVFISAMGTKVL